jgi:hypothetical protein
VKGTIPVDIRTRAKAPRARKNPAQSLRDRVSAAHRSSCRRIPLVSVKTHAKPGIVLPRHFPKRANTARRSANHL